MMVTPGVEMEEGAEASTGKRVERWRKRVRLHIGDSRGVGRGRVGWNEGG